MFDRKRGVVQQKFHGFTKTKLIRFSVSLSITNLVNKTGNSILMELNSLFSTGLEKNCWGVKNNNYFICLYEKFTELSLKWIVWFLYVNRTELKGHMNCYLFCQSYSEIFLSLKNLSCEWLQSWVPETSWSFIKIVDIVIDFMWKYL